MLRYSDIVVVCSGCKKSSIIFDWKWSCGKHDFIGEPKKQILYALAMIGNMGSEDQIKMATTKLL
jgi:hypothetical protein